MKNPKKRLFILPLTMDGNNYMTELIIDGTSPVYLQISKWIEDNILNGSLEKGSKIPSSTDILHRYSINSATTQKAVKRLISIGAVYKKRGIGMFVSDGARDIIYNVRKARFYDDYITSMLKEASKLGITKEQLFRSIETDYH